MKYHTARSLLGGHRFKARHQVKVTLDGKPDQAFEDKYVLRCSSKDACYGRHENSLEYGVEFYRIGQQTYFRHRYQRFLRFTEEPSEANLRFERVWGVASAIVELIGPQLVLKTAGASTVAGRQASLYRLTRGPKKPRLHRGRREWRMRLDAVSVNGEAYLDSVSGVPLKVVIRYTVSAPKEGRLVKISGVYEGAVTEVGKPQKVGPPADFIVARPRRREVQDLRLLGSHRLNPGWFRGGGPYAARRRRSASARPAMQAGRRPAGRSSPSGSKP